MFLRLENEPQYLILVLIEICSYDRVLKENCQLSMLDHKTGILIG